MPDATEVVRGFDRPNIVWSVFRTEHKWAKLRDVVQGVEGTGLVYSATRRGVERWTRRLQHEGVSAAGYHGRMDADEREARQQAWVDDEVRVIVATNAFGMGIDKPDVRFVVHVDVPSSLEAYYQEAGRAGRDGERAYAVLLFQEPDAETQEALIASSHPAAAEVRAVYDAVCNVGQVPVGSAPDGPLIVDRTVVQRITGFSRSKVRTAVELLDRQGAWHRLPRRRHYGYIRFQAAMGAVRRYANDLDNTALAGFVRTLLRQVHADAFSTWWPLDVRRLTERMDLSRERLNRGLHYLQERGLLDWRPPGNALQVELEFPRARKLPVDDAAVQAARARAETRLEYMLRYARGTACRRRFLLTYFGEAAPAPCGACDVCLGRHDPPPITPEQEPHLRTILRQVDAGRPRDDWFDADEVPRPEVDRLVNWLVARDYLRMDAPLEGTFELGPEARGFLD
jgi:ATP-dependent DNA helicase RecQ